jgi:hypothetical protein
MIDLQLEEVGVLKWRPAPDERRDLRRSTLGLGPSLGNHSGVLREDLRRAKLMSILVIEQENIDR